MRAVIFDFGGVVADFAPTGLQEFVADALRLTLEKVYATLFINGVDLMKGRVSEKEFWKNYALSVGCPLPFNWRKRLNHFLHRNIFINKEIIKTAIALNGKNIITPLLSNISPWQVHLFQKLGHFDHFDPLVFSCEQDVMKPEPEIFHLVCQKINLTPEECLFIDDSEENITTAISMGFHTIHFKSQEQFLDQLIEQIGYQI